MKKYSSYADLKISKPIGIDTKTPNSPSFRKAFALDLPVLLLSKDPFPIPASTKYSAGYIQRNKIFTKKDKDPSKENQATIINENQAAKQKIITTTRKDTLKPRKVVKKDSSSKKEKPQLELRDDFSKQERLDVQSPKAGMTSSKSKIKIKDKDSAKDKSREKKSKASGISTTSKAVVRKVQKKSEQALNDLVTKYEPQPKSLAHCISDTNLMRGMSFENKCKGYYSSTIYNAFYATKVSSFHQICKSHLASSIDFLTYARKTKNFMPKKCEKSVALPPTTRKTVIFDLDETLIHCNQSIDLPNDVALDIVFPNSTSIAAGINIRPYAMECLKELSRVYEVIVFTASHQCYANVIIDYLDPKGQYVSHRLFRDHCHKTNEGFYVKDLRILNRDLSNVLLVDNAAYSYCFQPENGVPIVPFYNNKTDWELKEVSAYLMGMSEAGSLRERNEEQMKLTQYHRFRSPRELINQLYMRQMIFEEENRRELGDEEDLELAIDIDNQFEERDLRTKILFAMQGLGSIRTILKKDGAKIEAYIKGEYCEESIKDLVKNIRKDVPENPKVSLILSQFNIVESDLIKILVLHAEDKKLSFWLLALLSYLTAKPCENLLEEDKEKLNGALREYKKSFMKNEGITYLILHISDYVKTPADKRQKAHVQMMEFIVILLRNLLQIRTTNVGADQLHSHFLVAMLKEDMIGPLFFLTQMEKGDLISRIEVPLLEIFYHIFTCFNPAQLYQVQKPLNLRQEALRLANKKADPVRHSRFMPNFQEKNQSGVTRVTHNLDRKQETLMGQRKVPTRMAELKKVQKIERNFIEQNFLEMLIEPQGEEKKKTTVREIIFEYAEEFTQVEFEILSKLLFDSIYKEAPKINKQNIIHYLLLCSWDLKMTRCKYLKDCSKAKTPQEKGQVEFEFKQILCVMQAGHFELIYKLLFREATREKKKNFDINMFHAALLLFLSYIEVIEDISMSFNMSDRKNANALMANMFRHDIARIFKIGFHQITHEKILRTLIMVDYKFFKLLSEYSKGKVLTIQTNRLLKRKKTKREAQDEEDEKEVAGFISEDSEDEGSNQDESFQEHEAKKPKKVKKPQLEEEEDFRFQERKFNEMTEFAVVADYEIISKHLLFLKNERFLDNAHEINIAIFFYFERIVKLLKGEWLFFQAETLSVFTVLLNHSQFSKEYKPQRDVIKQICTSFLKLMRTNNLALVESLFRYPNLQVKEQIMQNYSDGREDIGEVEHNMFTD